MRTVETYPTEPIECWPRMKELRREHFRHTWTARERGDVVIIGVVECFLGFLAGLGDYANPTYGPYFTRITRDSREAISYLEETEKRGYGHEICSSMRLHMGQMFRGLSTRNPLGGTCVPDLVFQFNWCHSASKMGYTMSKYLGIPFLLLDVPYEDTPANRAYLLAQLHDAIDWMERTTGRKYNDEMLIEATKNEWDTMVLWAKICTLNKAVPAPLDGRQLWSLRLPTVTVRHRREALKFYEALLDEVQSRVDRGISARGIETARLTMEPGPPFIGDALRLSLRYPEEYGAVFVGGEAFFLTFGAWNVSENGSWEVPQTLAERGIELRNRDEALEAQVELYLGHRTLVKGFNFVPRAYEEIVPRARDWHADGIVFHLNRGCTGGEAVRAAQKLVVQEAGIPNTIFEGSHADPRDIVLSAISDRYDSLLQSMGLRPIETKAAEGSDRDGEE